MLLNKSQLGDARKCRSANWDCSNCPNGRICEVEDLEQSIIETALHYMSKCEKQAKVLEKAKTALYKYSEDTASYPCECFAKGNYRDEPLCKRCQTVKWLDGIILQIEERVSENG